MQICYFFICSPVLWISTVTFFNGLILKIKNTTLQWSSCPDWSNKIPVEHLWICTHVVCCVYCRILADSSSCDYLLLCGPIEWPCGLHLAPGPEFDTYDAEQGWANFSTDGATVADGWNVLVTHFTGEQKYMTGYVKKTWVLLPSFDTHSICRAEILSLRTSWALLKSHRMICSSRWWTRLSSPISRSCLLERSCSWALKNTGFIFEILLIDYIDVLDMLMQHRQKTKNPDIHHSSRINNLICWLASLRTRSTSLPLSSSSRVRVLMVSFSEWISWSRLVMRLLREHTSASRSEMRARSSCSCKRKKCHPAT